MPRDAGILRVIEPVLDLAASPGGGVVSQARCGEAVRVVGAARDGRVEVAAGWGGEGEEERGWVPRAALAPGEEPDRWVVTAEALAFAAPTRRAGPPVARLPLGCGLGASRPADGGGSGFRAVTVRGEPLFVQEEDLAERPPVAASPAARLRIAESLIGRPYVWGGCTSLGLDCSGLVKLLASMAGVGLPHSAAGQAELESDRFVAVEGLGSAAPGDFVYLRPSRRGARVDHVVMNAGGGSVLHASAEGGPPAVRRETWAAVAPRGSVAAVRRLVDPAGRG
ncbi:C40 family peptidase [Phycisphaera mikurensis]|uniref:Peptidase C40 family protein n=1 Tax=Phycisphaera mikurensis (strain NBRC 102666 / KCTC 22515 / FYK2301M01) TaxID=1142394 RepID=I0IHL5_PHYMF|nr:NlpC/P60 family protein [Phycisphaera mikurensis]MBB6440998.1 cell wall-associated NlpC family hydrolase [Phycisphaera mikurensis]BAM04753.1 peptidase C40 family protein [Phycisphaera mikurensis NBRC 102666]